MTVELIQNLSSILLNFSLLHLLLMLGLVDSNECQLFLFPY